jgi:hypothetical protein
LTSSYLSRILAESRMTGGGYHSPKLEEIRIMLRIESRLDGVAIENHPGCR